MASYKYSAFLTKHDSGEFDNEYGPGKSVPYSGIYRCMGCGRELATNGYDPFPPGNHHVHTQIQGTIRWKLIVYADNEPK